MVVSTLGAVNLQPKVRDKRVSLIVKISPSAKLSYCPTEPSVMKPVQNHIRVNYLTHSNITIIMASITIKTSKIKHAIQ